LTGSYLVSHVLCYMGHAVLSHVLAVIFYLKKFLLKSRTSYPLVRNQLRLSDFFIIEELYRNTLINCRLNRYQEFNPTSLGKTDISKDSYKKSEFFSSFFLLYTDLMYTARLLKTWLSRAIQI
jgi:hypothetical protein